MAGFLDPEVYIDSYIAYRIDLLQWNATLAAYPLDSDDTVIDLSFFTNQTGVYDSDEAADWIDRNGDGGVNYYEWLLF